MHVKKDDNVIVISGSDKGKTGKVLKAFPTMNKVIIVGVNIRKVHQRARKSNQKGQLIEKAMPIHVSNVMKADAAKKKRT